MKTSNGEDRIMRVHIGGFLGLAAALLALGIVTRASAEETHWKTYDSKNCSGDTVSPRANAFREWACQKDSAHFKALDLKDKRHSVFSRELQKQGDEFLEDPAASPEAIAQGIAQLRQRAEANADVMEKAKEAASAEAKLRQLTAAIEKDFPELLPLIKRPDLDEFAVRELCGWSGGPDRRVWDSLGFVEGQDYSLRCEERQSRQ